MPRGGGGRNNNDADHGDRNILPPDRFMDDLYDEDDQELRELERRLNEEVDEDFFQEPKRFNTLHRVIDVLGHQMMDEKNASNAVEDLEKNNPAYKDLKAQQVIVEGAIEHMAVIHCADLNGSVIQVGRVARQFSDAVSKVRNLRKQVADIQDTLGAKEKQQHNAGTAMSLRELWLKKLECEATLSLLDRLDVVRAAPSEFDVLVLQCRIGAAVLTISRALQTMFSDDIAQVQALHKIMEQLLLRKQKAEEIVWDTLADLIYLRTGNGLQTQQQQQRQKTVPKMMHSAHSVSSESRRSNLGRPGSRMTRSVTTGSASVTSGSGGIVNPFAGRFAVGDSTTAGSGGGDDSASVDSNDSGASLFSLEEDETTTMDGATANSMDTGSVAKSGSSIMIPNRKMLIPIPIIEAELDLEADERRCLEEIALSGMAVSSTAGRHQRNPLPRYADAVLGTRILVECLAQLGRLDDVERTLTENLDAELRKIVQNEQARSFARLEKKRAAAVGLRSTTLGKSGEHSNLKDFRRHLTGLLSAFGCVIVRLSHLAEVLRIRIVRVCLCWNESTLLQRDFVFYLFIDIHTY